MVVADRAGSDPATIADRAPSAPPWSPLGAYLAKLHTRHRDVHDGDVATYIPELATADPRWFGIAIVTVDGAVHEVGDARVPFTIQSISKPLTYGLAIDRLGEATVRRSIDVEPTGEAFNAITLRPGSGRPYNPMVNAGAIAATALVADALGPIPIDGLLAAYGRFAGRPLQVDERVFRSERSTGHRNRAIGHLLRASGAISADAEMATDLYFRQCSVAVDARDLATIAATLANGGRNPVTGDRVLGSRTTQTVLSVMATCGMYDGAGEWMVSVGMPAKSGVSGGLIAVLPGQLGLAVFSPPLDPLGNSVRGIRICRDVSSELDLHVVARSAAQPSPIRRRYTVAAMGSTRRRDAAACASLERLGTRSIVVEIQGVLTLLAVERLANSLGGPEPASHVILDLRRVISFDAAVIPVVAELVRLQRAAGSTVIISGGRRHDRVLGGLDTALAESDHPPVPRFDDLDLAVEWIENLLLEPAGRAADEPPIALSEHALLAGLAAGELERVRGLLVHRRHPAGDRIVRVGDPATAIFLVTGGRLSVTIDLDGEQSKRLSTLGPGTVFGEAALLDPVARRRTADVTADGDVDCYALSTEALDALQQEAPSIAAVVIRNLARITFATSQRLTREVTVLAS